MLGHVQVIGVDEKWPNAVVKVIRAFAWAFFSGLRNLSELTSGSSSRHLSEQEGPCRRAARQRKPGGTVGVVL